MKLAVIVGSGPGLGFSIAKKLTQENFAVALISRNTKKLQTLVDEINQLNKGRAYSFSADVTDENQIKSVFISITKQLGIPDILFYNAASKFEFSNICNINSEKFIHDWKINCLGGLLAAQQVLPDMVKQKYGTIIFTGATAALRGSANMGSFAAGKFGQRALAQSMAREFGPQGIHIVHVIIDGQIASPEVLKMFPDRPLHTFLNPEAIAETYWQLYLQDHTAWTHEIDLRPAVEKF